MPHSTTFIFFDNVIQFHDHEHMSPAAIGPECESFLKWAGGKRWLVKRHKSLIDIGCTRYVEPFLGSGAVFFAAPRPKSLLSDCNGALIDAYVAIRDCYTDVERELAKHQRLHSTEHYYEVRASSPKTLPRRAAKFIYLNRTCWNGLYRVNRQGEFNVPIGTKSQVEYASGFLQNLSDRLKDSDLRACDFQLTIDRCGKGDFVFVDPPYTVKHNHNGFLKYNESIFSWSDQVRLRDSVKRASARGANVVVTNAFHESVVELYKGLGEHFTVDRASVIAGSSNARGRFEELIVRCRGAGPIRGGHLSQ